MYHLKISIIVPVFNVGSYISECLQSLLDQTYENIEIICVDDGSTDNSAEICNSFSAKDNRLKVIHSDNRGAGAARNIGLNNVTGEYIGFVDGDDYVSCNMYEELLSNLVSRNADIISCEFYDRYVNGTKEKDFTERIEELSCLSYLEKMVNDWKYYTMCNKLFKKDCIGSARFPEGNVIDDGFFTYGVFGRASKILLYDKPLYYYRHRKSSVMNKEDYALKRSIQTLTLHKERLQYIEKHYPTLIPVYQKKLLDEYSVVVRRDILSDRMEKNAILTMKENCRKALFHSINRKESIWFILFMYMPRWRDKEKKHYNSMHHNDLSEFELFE